MEGETVQVSGGHCGHCQDLVVMSDTRRRFVATWRQLGTNNGPTSGPVVQVRGWQVLSRGPINKGPSAAASDVARRRGVCRTSDPMVLVASRKLSCDHRGEDDENDGVCAEVN